MAAHQVFPVASGDALFQSDDPLAPVHVRLVLPHRLDPLAENMVVAHGRPVVDWPPQVDVETPEVLDLEIGKGGWRERWSEPWKKPRTGLAYGKTGPRETKWRALRTDSVVPSVEVFSS